MKMSVEEPHVNQNSNLGDTQNKNLPVQAPVQPRQSFVNAVEITKVILEKLQGVKNFGEVEEFMSRAVSAIIEEVQKDDDVKLAKLDEENKIMKRAFMKQFEKAEVLLFFHVPEFEK